MCFSLFCSPICVLFPTLCIALSRGPSDGRPCLSLCSHGAGAIHLTPLVAPVVGLLSDPTPAVRDAAFNTLVELYRHVGERLRHDLQRKHSVPQARWVQGKMF